MAGFMDEWALPDEIIRDAPLYAPRVRELADLQLLIAGALAPLHSFHTRADLERIRTGAQRGSVPVPVTLEIPASVARRLDVTNPTRRVITLTDPEGAPLAVLDAVDVWPVRDGWYGAGGPVRAVGYGPRGAFRQLRRRPDEVRPNLPAGRVLGVFADRPLHRPHLAQITHAARTIAAHVVVLIPVATPGPDGLPPEVLVRCVLAARDRLPAETSIVAVPLVRRGSEVADGLLRAAVARAYGATHLLAPNQVLATGGLRVILPREFAYESLDGQWRGVDDVPRSRRRAPLTHNEIETLLDRGTLLPEWHTPPAVAAELARARPPRRIRGVVVFFTGLSGAGKSAIAREVAAEVAETGERTVTLIDGDVVKRYLSGGLGQSRADRDQIVRRIGYVAAEAARHGGLAMCCPIAPYAESRSAARQLAHQAGAGFILVYVATPLDVCERRDPKGLYARARSGEIEAMTGVDEPYEVPTDADLVVDTSVMSLTEAVAAVTGHLTTEGWLDRP